MAYHGKSRVPYPASSPRHEVGCRKKSKVGNVVAGRRMSGRTTATIAACRGHRLGMSRYIMVFHDTPRHVLYPTGLTTTCRTPRLCRTRSSPQQRALWVQLEGLRDWLRRVLRQKHITDFSKNIWHAAAFLRTQTRSNVMLFLH